MIVANLDRTHERNIIVPIKNALLDSNKKIFLTI